MPSETPFSTKLNLQRAISQKNLLLFNTCICTGVAENFGCLEELLCEYILSDPPPLLKSFTIRLQGRFCSVRQSILSYGSLTRRDEYATYHVFKLKTGLDDFTGMA